MYMYSNQHNQLPYPTKVYRGNVQLGLLGSAVLPNRDPD